MTIAAFRTTGWQCAPACSSANCSGAARRGTTTAAEAIVTSGSTGRAAPLRRPRALGAVDGQCAARTPTSRNADLPAARSTPRCTPRPDTQCVACVRGGQAQCQRHRRHRMAPRSRVATRQRREPADRRRLEAATSPRPRAHAARLSRDDRPRRVAAPAPQARAPRPPPQATRRHGVPDATSHTGLAAAARLPRQHAAAAHRRRYASACRTRAKDRPVRMVQGHRALLADDQHRRRPVQVRTCGGPTASACSATSGGGRRERSPPRSCRHRWSRCPSLRLPVLPPAQEEALAAFEQAHAEQAAAEGKERSEDEEPGEADESAVATAEAGEPVPEPHEDTAPGDGAQGGDYT